MAKMARASMKIERIAKLTEKRLTNENDLALAKLRIIPE